MEIRVDEQKRKQSEKWRNIKFIPNILTNVKGSDKLLDPDPVLEFEKNRPPKEQTDPHRNEGLNSSSSSSSII